MKLVNRVEVVLDPQIVEGPEAVRELRNSIKKKLASTSALPCVSTPLAIRMAVGAALREFKYPMDTLEAAITRFKYGELWEVVREFVLERLASLHDVSPSPIEEDLADALAYGLTCAHKELIDFIEPALVALYDRAALVEAEKAISFYFSHVFSDQNYTDAGSANKRTLAFYQLLSDLSDFCGRLRPAETEGQRRIVSLISFVEGARGLWRPRWQTLCRECVGVIRTAVFPDNLDAFYGAAIRQFVGSDFDLKRDTVLYVLSAWGLYPDDYRAALNRHKALEGMVVS